MHLEFEKKFLMKHSIVKNHCHTEVALKYLTDLQGRVPYTSFGKARCLPQPNTDCPTIPISSGLSQFCLKILNHDQYAIGTGKIPISTRVVILSSNSHKRKRNAEYLTLVPRKTEETARNIKDFSQKLLC